MDLDQVMGKADLEFLRQEARQLLGPEATQEAVDDLILTHFDTSIHASWSDVGDLYLACCLNP